MRIDSQILVDKTQEIRNKKTICILSMNHVNLRSKKIENSEEIINFLKFIFNFYLTIFVIY